jgi:2-polyprenyl-3-methyl-5-hydroxy-6-metoxy-1,4-benzoquinol methylase
MEKHEGPLIKDYYGSIYKYINRELDFRRYKKEMAMELEGLIGREDRILDIGCGAGYLLKHLEEEGYSGLYGVEADARQCEEARKTLSSARITNTGALEYLRGETSAYDAILMIDLIEHLGKKDITELLSLARARLKEGGNLIIRTNNADSPLFSGRMRYLDFTHEVAFNEESMKMVLKDAGFTRIRCRAAGTCIMGPQDIIKLLVRVSFETVIRIYLRSYDPSAFSIIMTPNFVTVAER